MDKFAWVDDSDLLPMDSPERAFIVAMLIHTVQDARLYARAPIEHKGTPLPSIEPDLIEAQARYRESTIIHKQWIADPRFVWWCSLLGLSGFQAANLIYEVMNGNREVNIDKLRNLVGTHRQGGFGAWDDEQAKKQARDKGRQNRWEKERARKNRFNARAAQNREGLSCTRTV